MPDASRIDVLYLANNKPIDSPAVRKALVEFVNSGKGLVIGHAALWYNWEDWPEYNLQLVGGGARDHNQYGPFKVTIVNTTHPVTNGVNSFTVDDELYHYEPNPLGPGIEVLATAESSDKSYPSIFVVHHPRGRIVGIALGHDGASHNLHEYQQILRNAVEWAANLRR